MAQTGKTPILIYGSTTASNVPTAANLTTSSNGVELAINAADGKLYYKDSGGTVQILADKTRNSGTLSTANGGTGLTSFTANGILYASSTSALATGSALTFDGTTFVNNQASGSAQLQYNGLYFSRSGDNYLTATAGPLNYGGTRHVWLDNTQTSEYMRLTSTGLGIGTSSPAYKLDVNGAGNFSDGVRIGTNSTAASGRIFNNGTWGMGFVAASASTNAMGWFDSGVNTLMTLTSSGNLGLGVTPSAWDSTFKNIQIGGGGYSGSLYSQANGDISAGIVLNAYYNGGWKYTASSKAPTQYEQNNGVHKWLTAGSGTAGNAITFTQAMTLGGTSSPYLLVGTTVNLQSFPYQSVNQNGFAVHNAAESANIAYFAGGGNITLSASGNYAVINGTSGILFGYNGSEAARIDSSGNFLLGTTSQINGEKFSVVAGASNGVYFKNTSQPNYTQITWNSATSGDNSFIAFGTEATYTGRGGITYNRGAGLVAYNTTSDYRAKDILGSVENSGEVIDSVPVYMGKMKGATQERPMFIAHETPPYAHTGEKDAVDAEGNPVYQQMDASALVPVMWAEIQSLRKRLAAAGIA